MWLDTTCLCERLWCHSILDISSTAGSVSLSSLQRAAQAYTSFKDVSWAQAQHPCKPAHASSAHMIIKKKKKKKSTQPPGMCNSPRSCDVYRERREIVDEIDFHPQILSEKARLALCSTPYLQQCRETLTLPTMHWGRERHHHTHSDRACTEMVLQRMGEGKEMQRSRRRERWRRTRVIRAAASEKFSLNLHLREYLHFAHLTD